MIETRRLRIRRLSVSDRSSLELVLGNDEVMEFSDGVMGSGEIEVWLENQVSGRSSGIEIFAVEQISDGTFIGYCGLTYYPDICGSPEIEIGYRLIPEFWGCGYATEAATVVRDYGFRELNLDRLVALIDPSNTRSIGVATKIGMAYEKEVLLEGYDHPDRLYVINKSERELG